MANNKVIHFEIQADDVARAKDFYSKSFGWNIQQAMTAGKDGNGMDYWMIETGPKDMPGIGGGMYARPKDGKTYAYKCTVLVENIDEAMESIKKNGGKVTREKTNMEKIGWFAEAVDTEGNVFSIMQATDWKP
ncbi:MAG: VOC family protein [Candidatus Paceibacterota bacterium]|jgi:hypothetical protein|nr:VOC family protein [Candidatus Paceibacterota bacterium]